MDNCVMCGKPGKHDYGGGPVCSTACLASWEAAAGVTPWKRGAEGHAPELVAVPVGRVLADAHRVVESRGESYGTPRDNHERTAALWTVYLRAMLRDKVSVSARDVCMLNILQKVSRDAHRPVRDNLVDIAGYAENAGLCEDLPCRSNEPLS